MFPIIDVPDEAPDLPEQLGTKAKFWFQDDSKARYLFKVGRPDTGDDWSEKVACELCELLGIPHARYELATYKGERGVISPTFVPDGGRLVHGNELLARIEKYPAKQFFRVREHTLSRVTAMLTHQGINVPVGCESFPGVETAFDFFIGYLMLDTWIANQDRHHENWGLLVAPPQGVHLAPSYDHASCLGANETDRNRAERLNTRDVGQSIERYVTRARSAFYSSPSGAKPMPTLEAFRRVARRSPQAGVAWLGRLNQVSSNMVQSIFNQIPGDRITTHGIEFATKLLEINRHRLATLVEGLQQ